jgi:hypothetical protein
VHRAHSGKKGIVNSFETYENIRRFLFGDVRVRVWLENVQINTKPPGDNIDEEYFYLEFSLAVRGTGVFLHQTKQNPCENAFRFDRKMLPLKHHLHTGFLDTKLKRKDDDFLRFLMTFKISQHQIERNFFYETAFPERTIYSESMDVSINLKNIDNPDEPTVLYRWLSDTVDDDDPGSWIDPDFKDGMFKISFRYANTVSGDICIQPTDWNDISASQINGNILEI